LLYGTVRLSPAWGSRMVPYALRTWARISATNRSTSSRFAIALISAELRIEAAVSCAIVLMSSAESRALPFTWRVAWTWVTADSRKL
jgi:hypothetical protein